MSESVERPLASEETERRVVETIHIDMAPEEFAARDGYGWLDIPFGRFRYRAPALDRWDGVLMLWRAGVGRRQFLQASFGDRVALGGGQEVQTPGLSHVTRYTH